jgi:hypothetical protein
MSTKYNKDTHALNYVTRVLPWFIPLGYVQKNLALISFIIFVLKLQCHVVYNSSQLGGDIL